VQQAEGEGVERVEVSTLYRHRGMLQMHMESFSSTRGEIMVSCMGNIDYPVLQNPSTAACASFAG
jgi:hypothetical protein